MKEIKQDIVIKRDGCGTVLSVRHFPDRKKPALMVEEGNCGSVLAYFTSERSVGEFMQAISKISGSEAADGRE